MPVMSRKPLDILPVSTNISTHTTFLTSSGIYSQIHCFALRALQSSVPSIKIGGGVMQTTQRARPVSPACNSYETRENRTENDSRISKRIAMESGIFVERRMEGSRHCFSLAS